MNDAEIDHHKPVILDKKWFFRLRSLNKTYLSETEYQVPELKINQQKRSLEIQYFKTDSHDPESQRIAKANKGIKAYKKLIREVRAKEKNPFIKNYYEDKIKEPIRKLRVKKLFINHELSLEEKNQKIFEIQQRLHPLPPKEYFTLFTNEFINFIKYCVDENLFDIKNLNFINEITKHKFYAIDKVEVKNENYGEIIKSFLDFKEKNSHYFEEFYDAKQVRLMIKKFTKHIFPNDKIGVKLKARYTFAVNSSTQKIAVPKDIKLSKKRFYELVSHEIMVHINRVLCGKRNESQSGKKLKLLSIGRSSNIQIEEGIASYMEQNLFYNSKSWDIMNLFDFYMRIIVTQLALNFDPYEVYEKMNKLCEVYSLIKGEKSKFAANKCKTLLLRIYRDYKNPTKGNVNTVISQYLYGNRLIWEAIEKGLNINNLFAGKISLDDLTYVKKMKFNIPEDFYGEKDFPREFLMREIGRVIS